MSTALVIALAFCLLFFWLGMERLKVGVYAATFLAPWQGLDADVGLRVTGFRLAIAGLLLASLPRLAVLVRQRVGDFNGIGMLACLVAYAVIWTLLQISSLPELNTGGHDLRFGILRPIGQIIMFLMDLAPIFILPLALRNAKDVMTVGKVYILSTLMLAVLGWFQLAIWYKTGWNPFPIGIVNSLLGGFQERVYEGVHVVQDFGVKRMNSFGGEPKGLGQSLAIGLLLVQAWMLIGRRSVSKHLGKTWGVLAISMLATFSASAMYIWIIGSMVLILFGSFATQRAPIIARPKVKRNLFFSVLMLTAFACCFIVTLPQFGNDLFVQAFNERIVERGPIEDFDDAVVRFLSEQPEYAAFGVGLGNVHFFAGPYLSGYGAHYAAGKAFVAKSGYLRLISELGCLGLLMFVVWVRAVLSQLLPSRQQEPGSSHEHALSWVLWLFGWAVFVAFMARGGYVGPQFFLTIGVCTSLYLIRRATIWQGQRLFRYSPSCSAALRSL